MATQTELEKALELILEAKSIINKVKESSTKGEEFLDNSIIEIDETIFNLRNAILQ